jgi:hypothetical protein
MKTVLNKRFDLVGNELSRLLKIALFGKFVPIGNLRGGPGARCLAILSLLHYFGYPLYWIVARYGHKLQFLRRLVARLRR